MIVVVVFSPPCSLVKTPNSVLQLFTGRVFCVQRAAVCASLQRRTLRFRTCSCADSARSSSPLKKNLTSTRRPAPRHSRRVHPITARDLPRASPSTSDTISPRIAAIGWRGRLQPMARRLDGRVRQCRDAVKRRGDRGVNDHMFNFN